MMQKKSTKTVERPTLSKTMRAGDIAPFNGILLGDEDFKILLRAATKDCLQ